MPEVTNDPTNNLLPTDGATAPGGTLQFQSADTPTDLMATPVDQTSTDADISATLIGVQTTPVA